MNSSPYYIGKITIKSLQGFIQDNALSPEVALKLNQFNFDALADEHREMYDTALVEPYYIAGILIAEDNSVPKGEIALEENV